MKNDINGLVKCVERSSQKKEILRRIWMVSMVLTMASEIQMTRSTRKINSNYHEFIMNQTMKVIATKRKLMYTYEEKCFMNKNFIYLTDEFSVWAWDDCPIFFLNNLKILLRPIPSLLIARICKNNLVNVWRLRDARPSLWL